MPVMFLKSARLERGLIQLEVSHSKIQQTIWVDPSKGYCISRIDRVQHFSTDSDTAPHISKSSTRMTTFHDLGDGIFFPKVVEATVGEATPTVTTYTFVARARDWQLVPIKFNPGAQVFDLRAGKKVMTAQADGSLVEDEKLTRGFQRSSEEPRQAPPPTLRASLPTASEPWHWTAYILPGTAFLCGLLGLFWAIRWWQQRREAA